MQEIGILQNSSGCCPELPGLRTPFGVRTPPECHLDQLRLESVPDWLLARNHQQLLVSVLLLTTTALLTTYLRTHLQQLCQFYPRHSSAVLHLATYICIRLKLISADGSLRIRTAPGSVRTVLTVQIAPGSVWMAPGGSQQDRKIEVEKHDGDIRFQTRSRNEPCSCIHIEKYAILSYYHFYSVCD